MRRSWSSVYGKLVLGVWKELRLTGRGGRSGEKGYSDRSCVLCLVWSQKAKEDDEKNGEIGENEEGGEVGKRLRRVGHVRQSAGRTPSRGRVVAAIDRSNRLAPIGIRPPQVEETASSLHRVKSSTANFAVSLLHKILSVRVTFWPTRRISIAFARVR